MFLSKHFTMNKAFEWKYFARHRPTHGASTSSTHLPGVGKWQKRRSECITISELDAKAKVKSQSRTINMTASPLLCHSPSTANLTKHQLWLGWARQLLTHFSGCTQTASGAPPHAHEELLWLSSMILLTLWGHTSSYWTYQHTSTGLPTFLREVLNGSSESYF